ncbi:MAG TPA: FecR domain-containing protein [Polyangiaceae bacterium]
MIAAVVASDEVTGLARLAHESLGGEPAARGRDDGSFLRVQQKLTERAVARRRRAQIGGSLMAALVILAVTAWFGFREPAITYTVVNGAVVDGDHIVGGKRTAVRFSDGSEFSLEPGTDARVSEVTPHGGRVSLVGSARVAIAKKPRAVWTVAAGPYTVHVTGTAFDVSWSPRDQSFELAMQSGSVIVEGPFIAGGGIALKRGQRLSGGLGTQKVVVEDIKSGVRAAAPPVAPSSPADEPAAVAANGAGAGAKAPPPELGWAKSVAQGKFAAVLDEAEKRGLDHTIATAPLGELSALADAARYGRRTALARRVLLAERSRFPGSRSAVEAAFFLGRIAEDEGGDAIEWYDRYLAESGKGSYASQALGRKMMLVYGKRGAQQTRSLAEDYLGRYPNGPYAAAAKKILDEPSRPSP